jgi:hypothetical protein
MRHKEYRNYFKGIKYWNKITKTNGGYVVYGGSMEQKRSTEITVLPYYEMSAYNFSN